MIILPWPPTVNTYWRTSIVYDKRDRRYRCRQYLSRQAVQYRDECAEVLMQRGIPKYGKDARLRIEIEAHPPDERRRDLDNILKALFDVLQHYRVVADDACFHDIRLIRLPIFKGKLPYPRWKSAGRVICHIKPHVIAED